LLVMLAIPLLVSDLVRRSLEHVRDTKRQRQLNSIRRILTGVAMFVILLFSFISDFSSFATFAGFMTAGLAVALQSVLLSLVAHFLFYGRYGVRNGDRVHVAGVTGDIAQIGMVRFYLRELKQEEDALVPTGKIVAFPNSILFQNIAFYKYA
jgi:small-conductance mechanosensitive channel